MRMHRVAVAAAGVVLASLPVSGSPAGAVADQPKPSYRMAEAVPPEPPSFAGPTRRTIYSEVVSKSGRLYLRGDVHDYVNRTVVIQRKTCESCEWGRYDVVETGDHGWFRSLIGAPRKGSTFWRAKVAPSDGYERSYSATWETYY